MSSTFDNPTQFENLEIKIDGEDFHTVAHFKNLYDTAIEKVMAV